MIELEAENLTKARNAARLEQDIAADLQFQAVKGGS
jgi:hypothetical protein